MITPKTEWVKFGTVHLADMMGQMFYGRVNIGTEYECYTAFFGRYSHEHKNIKDLHGDTLPHEATHVLVVDTTPKYVSITPNPAENE